jgi:transcriptional regulator with XRE-family HTH domain
MGRSAREKPRKLGKKLKHIRVVELGLSQTQMAEALGLKINYSAIGQYERGAREPTLPILLKYARLIGISTDILIDDKLNIRPNTGKKFSER